MTDLLERVALSFRDEEQDEDEVDRGHRGENKERSGAAKVRLHQREELVSQVGEDPDGSGCDGHSGTANFGRKYFGYDHPADGTVPDCVAGYEGHNAAEDAVTGDSEHVEGRDYGE